MNDNDENIDENIRRYALHFDLCFWEFIQRALSLLPFAFIQLLCKCTTLLLYCVQFRAQKWTIKLNKLFAAYEGGEEKERGSGVRGADGWERKGNIKDYSWAESNRLHATKLFCRFAEIRKEIVWSMYWICRKSRLYEMRSCNSTLHINRFHKLQQLMKSTWQWPQFFFFV